MSDHAEAVYLRLREQVDEYTLLREQHGFLRGRIKGAEIEIATLRAAIGPTEIGGGAR